MRGSFGNSLGAVLRLALLILALSQCGLSCGTEAYAEPAYDLGASDSEIKIGQTAPYSGPLSSAGQMALTEVAFVNMINESGGVNGRKITLISLDDAFSPPKAVEQVRRLVEQDDVLAIFNQFGTPTSIASQKYPFCHFQRCRTCQRRAIEPPATAVDS